MSLQMKYKKLKHYNDPGHAHELTFSCYHSYSYLHDEVNAHSCTFNYSIFQRPIKTISLLKYLNQR